ncbi:MAG TPA: hypothetical protein VNA04_06280 [Thermoanaerobaculia bacterium]|nr:hypothetical protein [Thermoanaerobaculia bacterium]
MPRTLLISALRSITLVALLAAPFAAHAEVELAPPPVDVEVGTTPVALVTNGDGFLAVFRRETPNGGTAAMPLDRDGRRLRDAAVDVSASNVSVTAAENRYLALRQFGGVVEIAPDGRRRAEWDVPGIVPSQYEITATGDGRAILLTSIFVGRAYLFTASGQFLREVAWPAAPAQNLGVAAGPDRFVWLTRDGSDIVLRTIPADGSAEPPAVRVNSAGLPGGVMRLITAEGTILVFTPVEFFGPSPPPPREYYALFISRTGAVGAAQRIEAFDGVSIDTGALVRYGGGALFLAVTPTGTVDGSQVWRVVRLESDGRPIDRQALVLSDVPVTRGVTRVASNGETVVIYSGSTALSLRNLTEAHRETIPLTRRSQQETRVAGAGAESLVVWNERAEGGDRLMARRVSTSAPLGEPFLVARSDGFFGTHAVAAGAGMYLVVWHHWQQLWGLRIASDGTFLDREPLLIRNGVGFNLKVAAESNGSDFMIVWQEAPNAIAGTLLSPNGRVAGIQHIGEGSGPDVAWDGRGWIVVWSRVRGFGFPGSPLDVEVRAARLAADGVLQAGSEVLVAAGVNLTQPRVASGPAGSLMTFSGLAAHLAPESLRPSTVFAYAPLHLPTAKPRFDGRDFALAWRDLAAAYHYLGRITPGATVVRRSLAVSNRRPDPFRHPVDVAVSDDGSAALIAQEWRAYGDEAPTWRIIFYGHDELAQQIRRRSVRF